MAGAGSGSDDESASYTRSAGYGRVDMAFEVNAGQTDARVQFLARGRDYSVFLTPAEVVLSLAAGPRRSADDARSGASEIGLEHDVARAPAEALRMAFVDGNPTSRLLPERKLPGTVNYLRGRDASRWRRNLPTFASVRYEGIYPGIDVLWRGSNGRLEPEFVVAPGADPSRIRIRFAGAESLAVADGGDLFLNMRNGDVRHQRAVVFQEVAGAKQSVAARFVVAGDEVSLAVGAYDSTAKLVVSTTLDFATYLGTSVAADSCRGVAVDAEGAIYVTGATSALDFPTTEGAYRPTTTRSGEAFVAKLAPGGDAIAYATYLGGSSGDTGVDIAVGADGAAYVLGETTSPDFPTSASAFDRLLNLDGDPSSWEDAFVAKLSPDGGALLYSTFLGGDAIDWPTGLAADASGNVYVAGYTISDDFPTTAGAHDPSYGGSFDGFVSKLNATGSALVFSTFLGGQEEDQVWAVAVNASGDCYVTGRTLSPEFPTTPGAFNATYVGGEAFVTKFGANGASLSFSTFLAPGSTGRSIAVDASGRVCVAGETGNGSFPTTAGAYDRTHNGGVDLFVTWLSPSGSAVVASSYLGGPDNDGMAAMAIDAGGAVYVTGTAIDAPGFPTTPGAFDTTFNGPTHDAVAAKLSANVSALEYSTFLGGSSVDRAFDVAADPAGAAVVVGDTWSLDFPRAAGVQLPEDSTSGFVARLAPTGAALLSSTRLGGVSQHEVNDDFGAAIFVDAEGAAYITGAVREPNFPTTPGAVDPDFGGYSFVREAFVAKLSPDGTSLLYSTYLGGATGEETGAAIVVDESGAVYVAGDTSSQDFPRTPGAYGTQRNGLNTFVVKLSPDGSSLLYASDFGGSGRSYCYGLHVDASGAIFVAGETEAADYPTTPGAFDRSLDGPVDGFVAKLAAGGASLEYATYLGGGARDRVYGLAVDGSGAALVTGETLSTNFPVTAGALDATFNGGGDRANDAFVTKLVPSGAALAYSTFLGGRNDDEGRAIGVDADGACYVTGSTRSLDYPATPGGLSTPRMGAMVTKLAPDGGLAYSAFLGGHGTGLGIAVGPDGSAFVTGSAVVDLLTTPGAHQPTPGGRDDAFLARVHPSGASLLYSSYVGDESDERGRGVAIDSAGGAYLVGDATDFEQIPVTFGYADGSAVFVLKMVPALGAGGDTAGIYVPASGVWFLRDSNTSGGADSVFGYGSGGSDVVPLRGDWDGDGDDTAGLYNLQSGFFFLENTNGPGGADLVFGFGPASAALIPLAGDWNGDGADTVGLYDPAAGVFFLRDVHAAGPADVVVGFGPPGVGWIPLAGDWDGDGDDTVGLYDPATGFFFLRNVNASGGADLVFGFGAGGGLRPLAGDWNGDGIDTVGLYAAATGSFFLRDVNESGPADVLFGYGPPDSTPVVGDWDGL